MCVCCSFFCVFLVVPAVFIFLLLRVAILPITLHTGCIVDNTLPWNISQWSWLTTQYHSHVCEVYTCTCFRFYYTFVSIWWPTTNLKLQHQIMTYHVIVGLSAPFVQCASLLGYHFFIHSNKDCINVICMFVLQTNFKRGIKMNYVCF